MTLCFEVKEESDKRQESSLGEINKTLAILEAIPICLNWGQIFSLPNEARQHMVTPLKHPELFSDKVNWGNLRENGVLPVSKMTKAPFSRLLEEESNLPIMDTSDRFDPDAYNLMEESGYDFSEPQSPGYVIAAKPYGTNGAQKMVQKQGDKTMTPRIGLSYMPSQLVKISRRCKDKQSFTKHDMAKEAGNGKGDNGMSSPKIIGVQQVATIDTTSTTFYPQEDGKGQDS